MSEIQQTINLPEPHYHQKQAIYYASQESDCEILTLCAGRRAGKSYALQYILLQTALSAPGLHIWYVCYTDNQTKEFFWNFEEHIRPANIVKKVIKDKGDYRIIFFNDSVIYFKSSRSGDSLRGGQSITLLVCDEFAYIKDEVFEQVLLPQLATKTSDLKSKIVLASSPRGKTNQLYKYFQLGVSEKPEHEHYKSLKFNIFDNPAINEKFVANAKATMTDAQYRQEILGEFVDSANVFNHVHECAVVDRVGEDYNPSLDYFLGVDVGLKVDNTVFTIVYGIPGTNNQKVRVAYQFAVQGWLSTQIEDFIVSLNKSWKFRRIYVEQNSSGLPIITNLLHRYHMYNCEGFLTSSKSKGIIINQLAHLFNHKNIEIINDDLLKEELNDFITVETATGYLKYEGLERDDRVMSLAIAVECWMQNKSSGEYNIQVLKF